MVQLHPMECTVENLDIHDPAGRPRLSEINLVAAMGQFLAVVGPPGSGKTLLLRALTGALPSGWTATGDIRWSGDQPEQAGRAYRLPAIRLVEPERGDLPRRKVRDSLRTRARLVLSDGKAVDRWLERVLTYFPHLAHRLDQSPGNLSNGEQRLLGLQLEVAGRPRCLAIDRPGDGVSPLSLPELFDGFRAYAREQQAVVICAEQNAVPLLRAADAIAVLYRGRLVFHGSPTELRADPATLALLGLVRREPGTATGRLVSRLRRPGGGAGPA